MNTVQTAEAAIARLLRDLELATGALVEALELEAVDVSTVEQSLLIRTVRIRLRPVPGVQWTQAGD